MNQHMRFKTDTHVKTSSSDLLFSPSLSKETIDLLVRLMLRWEPYQEKAGRKYIDEAQLAHFVVLNLEAWRNQLRDSKF